MMYNYPFYSFSKRYTRYPSYSYAQSRSKNYPQFDGVLPPSFPQNPQREGSSEQSNFNKNVKKNINYNKNDKNDMRNDNWGNDYSRNDNLGNNNIRKNSFSKNIQKKETLKEDDTDTLFEIFGIKLHSDDLLLICLIFFLYKEGVQDQYLFIALILLLLS